MFQRILDAIDAHFDRRRLLSSAVGATPGDHAQEPRPDRADAARRPGRGRDARALHAGREAGRDDARDRRGRARGARRPRRALQLPQLPRLPRGDLHVAERRDRARHPRRRRARGGRHPVARLRGDHRGLARRRRDHGADRRDRRRVAATSSTSPRRSLDAAIEQRAGRATRSATSAPRCRRSRRRGGYSVVREYVGHGIGTAMHEDPQIPNYAGGPNQRYKLKQRPRGRDRADGERRQARRPARSATAGPSSPPTASARPTSSTPSPAPTTAPRSSPSPEDLWTATAFWRRLEARAIQRSVRRRRNRAVGRWRAPIDGVVRRGRPPGEPFRRSRRLRLRGAR